MGYGKGMDSMKYSQSVIILGYNVFMQNLIGQTIQGYDLRERIGAGGFGAVYRAYQSTVGREVAVKIILPAYANSPDFIRRFEKEAQLIANLEHLHIVPLYDYWRDLEGAYIVMRWLRGGSLGEALREEAFDLEPASLLLDQVTAGLAAAHGQQIVHRDLKPSNILLDEEGNAYLADFGIARDLRGAYRELSDGAERHNKGKITGSLGYMSPEQIRGEGATFQSDIYSLGITLYETLTGRHPFSGHTSVQRLYKIINEPLPRIEFLDSSVSDGVNKVIQKATAKNPKHRYQDALTMAAAFRQAAKLSQNGQMADLVESLTLREQEILRLIVEGETNKQIAQSLFVELPTVKWHITKIYKKLGVRSRVQAIVRARELNLIVSTDENELGVTEATSISVILPEPANPYKGLRAFEPADNRDFFGREALIEHLLARFAVTNDRQPGWAKNGQDRFLAIVGPSGSGKSSLVKAGLIPALWSGKLPGSEKWFIVHMVPGSRPLDELEIALTRIAADQATNLRGHLDRDGYGLSRAAGLILPNDDSELVVVIDQFEELFTLVEDESVQSQFMDLIHGAVTDPRGRVWVIITLRADFYDRPLQYPSFGELLRGHMETLLPLSAEELERAIVNPAQQVGITFQPGLVATIIEDVNYGSGTLPLLQFALTELFEQREGRLLTGEAYTAIGGATGALAKRAEELYQEQAEEGREAIHQMFLRLVTVARAAASGADGLAQPETRRRVLRSELLSATSEPDQLDEIIDTYADYRLLSLDHHPATRQPTVEVAHEAILGEWERLRVWLEESQADLSLHRQLGWATASWIDAGGDESFLLRGTRLAHFETWVGDTQLVLTKEEQAYLDASIARREDREAAERERQEQEARLEQRSSRRLKALVAVMAVALVVAVGLAIAAIIFAGRAEEQQHLAVARELAAAGLVNLQSNPERSVLLALEAAETTYSVDETVLPEVEDLLHQAVQANRIRLSIPMDGAVAFSPDGMMLAIGDQSGLLKLWDPATGQLVKSLDAHLDFITAVAFSPDGRFLATASFDRQVKIWAVTQNGALLNLKGHDGSALDVAFDSDGERLAMAGEDGTVRIWDVSSVTGRAIEGPEPVQAIESALVLEVPGEASGVAFSPDGDRVAAIVPGHSLFVWDVTTGEQLLEIPGAGELVVDIAFSPDGQFLASGSGDVGAAVWDADTGEVAMTFSDFSPIARVAYSQDGRYLGTAGMDGTVTLWHMESGQQTLRISAQASGSSFIAFSPDGQKMATGGGDGMTRIWDVTPAGSTELFTIAAHEGKVYDVVYNPEGTKIASTGEDGLLKVWDSITGQLLYSLPSRADGVHFPAFSPDGGRLAAANREGGLSIWDAATGQELMSLRGDAPTITTVAFNPDGTKVAAAGGTSGIVHIWDTASGERLVTFQNDSEIMRLVFTLSGEQIWSHDWRGSAKSWIVATGEPMTGLRNNTRRVCYTIIWDAELSPGGRFWAAAGYDGQAYVFEAKGEPEDDAIYSIVYSLRRHSGNVTGVAFNPESTILATSAFDGKVKLWDMETGDELLTLTDRALPLGGVDFSPDGRYVVTAGSDGTISTYIVSVEELMDVARSRLTRDFTQEECQLYLHLPMCPKK